MNMNVSDIDLLKIAKSSSELQVSQARMLLWEKYSYFIQKKYFQWINTFKREKVEFEDYMQEAFLAMVHAIDLCDLERMEEKNVKNFSTILYFQLIKIKNSYDIHYKKYGSIINYSEINTNSDNDKPIEEQFNGINSVASQWISATSIDFDTQQKIYIYETLIQQFKNSLDEIDKIIYQLMIEKKKMTNIIELLSSRCDEKIIKQRIRKIKINLKRFVEENAYA